MPVTLKLDGLLVRGGSAVMLAETRALLAAVADRTTLKSAAGKLGLSYRSAWGKIAKLERELGRPVVVKTKGHGSVLTAFGAELHAALDGSFARLEPQLAAEEAALAATLGRMIADPPAHLRLAASHDPVLCAVIETLPEIALSVAGSTQALARLASGEADAAAFHFGSEGAAPPPFDALFCDPGLTVKALFAREQGLMLAPGNPLAITAIADIPRRGARFVNRQRGAGTRIWFERLCTEAAIRPNAIIGFNTEEFTHQAVAALIATGAADAGMGTRAIARTFALAFVPLGWETYYLAARASSVDPAALEALGRAAERSAGETEGYRAYKNPA